MTHTIINDYSTSTPSDRFYKIGWKQLFTDQKRKVESNKPDMVIIGDSIAKGLMRYEDIWKTFDSFNTVNMGIGGDKCQHVLWRCQNINFPSTVKYSVLIVGTNNIDSSSPNDIANSIIRIALSLANENKNMRVIILGILPRDMDKNSIRRYKISECNDI